MNKQETLVWLADRLDSWPSSVKRAPLVEGWKWLRNELNLDITLTTTVDQCSDIQFIIITQKEWEDECQKDLPASLTTAVPIVEAMVDIETFDTEDSAIMFEAAIVMFDRDFNIVYQEKWILDFDEQFKAGRTVSASTVAFHLGIPGNAKAALENSDKQSMGSFTVDFTQAIERFKPHSIWQKGDMDLAVLESIYDHVGADVPWTFRMPMELRTLMRECAVARGDVAHTAIDDCLAQIKQLKTCRRIIDAGKNLLEALPNAVLAAPSNEELNRGPQD